MFWRESTVGKLLMVSRGCKWGKNSSEPHALGWNDACEEHNVLIMSHDQVDRGKVGHTCGEVALNIWATYIVIMVEWEIESVLETHLHKRKQVFTTLSQWETFKRRNNSSGTVALILEHSQPLNRLKIAGEERLSTWRLCLTKTTRDLFWGGQNRSGWTWCLCELMKLNFPRAVILYHRGRL